MNQYNIFYMKKNISSADDKTIREIINKDTNPLFKLVKKNQFFSSVSLEESSKWPIKNLRERKTI